MRVEKKQVRIPAAAKIGCAHKEALAETGLEGEAESRGSEGRRLYSLKHAALAVPSAAALTARLLDRDPTYVSIALQIAR